MRWGEPVLGTCGGASARMLDVPELLVISGPPGAGKTTVARRVRDLISADALVPGDDFFALLGDRLVPPWLPAAQRQNEVVVDAAAAATGRLVAGGFDVVYDGVIGAWFVPAFLAAAGLRRMHYAVLLPSEQECVRRVSTRRAHGFTDLDATRSMYRAFAGVDLDPRHVVAGDDRPLDEQAETVARRFAAGSLLLEA